MEMLLEELFTGNGYRVDRLGEGGKDEGCDLLIKYPQDGSIRFVLQAKNWNKHIDKYDIKKEHAKFSDNYRKRYDLNTTHFCFVSWNFVREIKTQLTHELNIKVWDEKDIIANLFKSYILQRPQYPTLILEPYQESALEKIFQFWSEDKRCYVEHATGTGKTYIIARLTQHLFSNTQGRILILSPSTYINDRIYSLLENTVPSKQITRTLRQDKRIHLLTYQYLMHNSERILSDEKFPYIIMDEAHRAGAPEWHTRGLLNAIDERTSVVGLSATMQRYSRGMDIKEFLENNSVGRLSLFEAMARGILPTGEYVYSVVDMQSKVEELKGEIESKYERDQTAKDYLLNQLDAREIKDYSIQKIIHKYYHSHKYRKIIAFCEDIEHTYEIQLLLIKTFLKFSKVRRFEVHSNWSKKENIEQLNRFSDTEPRKNEIYILTAVDMLNEGIDVSGIDSVMLFRRTESPRVYLQQIGRCIRRHGVKEPLIFDCVLNFQNVDIRFCEEAKKEFDSYNKALEEFGFKDTGVPKTVQIYDEVQNISKIIKEVEQRLNLYPMYEDAKEAVGKLGIISKNEYNKRYKEDPRLPSAPDKQYKNKGWISWFEFFGKETPDFYPTYGEARKAVIKLRIKQIVDYQRRYKEDPRLPSAPDKQYKNKGWISWFEFFGKETPDFYPTYGEARKAVIKLRIKQIVDYQRRYKEDPRLPSQPNKYYKKKGWINWFEFFGKETPDFYPTYGEARKAVKRLKITFWDDYRKRYKEDPRLPSVPHVYYKNKGWISWPEFFGKGKPHFYPTYIEAKSAVKMLGIFMEGEYRKRRREDPRLPCAPDRHYKNKGWINWFEFFGKETPDFYPTYGEARKAVKRLKITFWDDYRKRYKKDPRLPSQPNKYYKKRGWINWPEFFGKGKPDFYPTYIEAKSAVKMLGIFMEGEYRKRRREDPRLPSHPDGYYKNKGWVSWPEFLDKEPSRNYQRKKYNQPIKDRL
jgi:superfamily II DNA or RNA helicase